VAALGAYHAGVYEGLAEADMSVFCRCLCRFPGGPWRPIDSLAGVMGIDAALRGSYSPTKVGSLGALS